MAYPVATAGPPCVARGWGQPQSHKGLLRSKGRWKRICGEEAGLAVSVLQPAWHLLTLGPRISQAPHCSFYPYEALLPPLRVPVLALQSYLCLQEGLASLGGGVSLAPFPAIDHWESLTSLPQALGSWHHGRGPRHKDDTCHWTVELSPMSTCRQGIWPVNSRKQPALAAGHGEWEREAEVEWPYSRAGSRRWGPLPFSR